MGTFAPVKTPLAWLITMNCYGAWLARNEPGASRRPPGVGGRPRGPSAALERWMRTHMAHSVLHFDEAKRAVVEESLRETCRSRNWVLHASKVSMAGAIVVVSAPGKPEPVMGALKARATRSLREAGLVMPDRPVWAGHGSTRYLWSPGSVEAARRFVEQGWEEPSPLRPGPGFRGRGEP